jgi:hypothetical protein
MIPQDSFVIVARVGTDVAGLRRKLAEMNFPGRTGFADPENQLLPFGKFDAIHFARFVVLADNTLDDRARYPELPKSEPTYLCFMVDCDGDAGELLDAIVQWTSAGLREIFQYCEDFDPNANLLGWLRAHRVRPRASYVNWVGRTAVQAREEAELQGRLRDALRQTTAREPQQLRGELLRLTANAPALTKIPPTPLPWRLRNLAHMLLPILIAAVCLLLFPILTIAVIMVGPVLFFIALRKHEQADPIICQPYEREKVELLRAGEDHDVSNQYTAMGSIKPGRFRLWTEIVILYALNWIARHICTRGSLGRISTIHFAHWSPFLDNNRRGFFCSNYDGGHEAYMDDFINKAGFGLNFSFSSFMAYPTTAWLFAKGAWLEQDFKRFQRHHQIPTDVWYKAYPGLTAQDLARNSRIRNGFEKTAMSDDEIRRWVAEI